MKKEIIKEYSNDELTVVWKPSLCIHAGVCVKTLPDVYDPKAKPWIKPENATTEQLKKQIDQCPSGALSYTLKNQQNPNPMESKETKVEVFPNGPILVHGDLTINHAGKTIKKGKTTAFCRCGHSNNKPYCDGMHNKEGFKAE